HRWSQTRSERLVDKPHHLWLSLHYANRSRGSWARTKNNEVLRCAGGHLDVGDGPVLIRSVCPSFRGAVEQIVVIGVGNRRLVVHGHAGSRPTMDLADEILQRGSITADFLGQV